MIPTLPQLLLFFAVLWQRCRAAFRTASSTVLTGESTSAEWTSAAFSLILAAVLTISTTTFDLSPVYDPVTFMDEQGWGILFSVHAGTTITAWWLNHSRMRRVGLLCSTALWTAWLSMLVKDTPQTTGWVYLVPAMASFVGYMRLSQSLYLRRAAR
jgi:hypothetical protein